MAHIAVDLDDVVLDFCGGLVTAMNKEFDAGLTLDSFEEWDLKTLLDPVIGRSWWDWLRERDWLWANFDAIDGSLGGLEKLRRDGHYLECVTSKPQWAEASVWKWLGKWRPPFQAVTIVDTAKEGSVRKVDVTEASILIDDKPSNIADFCNEARSGILFDRPHNLKMKPDTKAVWAYQRAAGWTDVLNIITERGEWG